MEEEYKKPVKKESKCILDHEKIKGSVSSIAVSPFSI